MLNPTEVVKQLEAKDAEIKRLRHALAGLVDAVGNMRVPQNVVDAAFQLKISVGPAYENAIAALT